METIYIPTTMTPKSPKRYKLSNLICTLENRKPLFSQLMIMLKAQQTKKVEILYDCDKGELSIGEKRNKLLNRATGDYVAFIDDDDWVDSEYMFKIIEALKSDPDCVQLIGMMNTDGYNQTRFEHSILHPKYYDHGGVYYRYPNHLNPIRRDIAQRFKFPEVDFGEDTEWATQIRDSALLQREEPIDKVIYHYRYSSRK